MLLYQPNAGCHYYDACMCVGTSETHNVVEIGFEGYDTNVVLYPGDMCVDSILHSTVITTIRTFSDFLRSHAIHATASQLLVR
jgi:hypothetical protein